MTILSAQSILKRKIISPAVARTVIRGKTYGISAAGYDVRVDFTGLNFMARCMRSEATCSAEANFSFGELRGISGNDSPHFFLAATKEHFTMPDDVIGIVHDKSSWARRGLAVQNTVIEPGWRGYLTLELTYHGPVGTQIVIEDGDPIAQIVFHQLDEPTIFPYDGKYQDQKAGPQPAIDETS